MKSRFLLIFILALAPSIFSARLPIDKGSCLLSGQASISSHSGELWEDATRIWLNPEISWFAANGFALGVHFDLSYTSARGYYGSSTDWGIGPIFSFYFNGNHTRSSAKGAVYPMFKVFGLTRQSTHLKPSSMWTVGGQLGVDFMLSNSVAIQPSILQRFDFVHYGYLGTMTGKVFAASIGIEAFIF